MRAFARRRRALTCGGIALAAVLGAVAPVMASSRVQTLPGVPRNASLLFALNFQSGTMRPDHRAGTGDYVLTLSGLERSGTWFSDRPVRDAGRVRAAALFGAWASLGFAVVPPNAALVLDSAPANRDAIAVELRLRSFDPRTATVTFVVRTLDSLGHDLRTLNRRLGLRLGRYFASGSLLIDNATYSEGCTLGQPVLMAVQNAWQGITDMVPANGQQLPISSNKALFALYGTTFGGNGQTTFGVPNIPVAPFEPAAWYICTSGVQPTAADMGGCWDGQVSYLIPPGGAATTVTDPDWLPADGQTVPASSIPSYSSLYNPTVVNSSGGVVAPAATQIALPDVMAPAGMRAYVCVAQTSTYPFDLAEAELFPATGTPNQAAWAWLPANGQTEPINPFVALYSLVGPGNSTSWSTFTTPSLPAPNSGVSWWISAVGLWPLNH